MITLEQIRLLEGKITRAIELIRVLKEENAALRKGLESAQKRMKELEGLVEGFKADQREIESVILRTMHHLDELEDGATGTGKKGEHGSPDQPAPSPAQPAAQANAPVSAQKQQTQAGAAAQREPQTKPTKEELDIF
jgi:peptidoglycan hydrolase CwlO-like protein